MERIHKNKIKQMLYPLHQHNKITKTLYNFIMIMGVHSKNNKLVIITEPKSFHFDLPKDGGKSLKHETDSTIKHNEFLAEHTIKSEISRLLFK